MDRWNVLCLSPFLHSAKSAAEGTAGPGHGSAGGTRLANTGVVSSPKPHAPDNARATSTQRQSVAATQSLRHSDHTKTPWPIRKSNCNGMVMSPVHQVWPKSSCKAQWKGEEDKADRGRGGKITSGNGQACGSPSPRGQVENREPWRNLVAKSFVVPQRPSWLRDKWDEKWEIHPGKVQPLVQRNRLQLLVSKTSGRTMLCRSRTDKTCRESSDALMETIRSKGVWHLYRKVVRLCEKKQHTHPFSYLLSKLFSNSLQSWRQPHNYQFG